MAGILANSATVTMTSGTPDASATGYLVGERITLTTNPTGSNYLWSIAKPGGSSIAAATLNGSDGYIYLVPDVEGYYTVTVTVDTTTTYVLRIGAQAIGEVNYQSVSNYSPLANTQVPTPTLGGNLYYSSTADGVVYKKSDGSVISLLNATLADGGVTTVKLADNGVTAAKLDAKAAGYATYAEARAAITSGAIVAGDRVRVHGRLAMGDGGQDWFDCIASSATDNGGTILTANAGTATPHLKRDIEGPVYPEWFGAVANALIGGTVTCGTQLQAALDFAATAKRTLKLGPGYYRTEINITSVGVDLEGDGFDSTYIKRITNTGEFTLALDTCSMRYLTVDASTLTTYAVKILRGATQSITECYIENATRDGIYFAQGVNNNNFQIIGGVVRVNGTSYSTGTASGTSGTSSVTISGAADLTTLGFRADLDYIYFPTETGNFKTHEIKTITSNTVTFYPPLASTLSSAAYAIKSGSGVQIDQSADGLVKLRDVVIQDCQAVGVQCQALYGVKTTNCIFESNFISLSWGARDRSYGNVFTISPASVGDYFENSTSGIDLLNEYAGYSPVLINHNEACVVRTYTGSYRPDRMNESGTWTPIENSGASLSITTADAYYTRHRDMITAWATVTFPTTANGDPILLEGLPFPSATGGGVLQYNTSGTSAVAYTSDNGGTWIRLKNPTSGANLVNSAFSAATFRFVVTYRLFGQWN